MTAIRGFLGRPVVAVLAAVAIAGVVRLWDLGRPADRVFDEIYYSKDACVYLGRAPSDCGIRSDDERYWIDTRGETSWVHPPLGKWVIAAGEATGGADAFGWRLSSAVVGTASVAIVAVIAQLLFGSPLWTFLAGLLLATEHLHFVQSRTAMLDIFLAFWVVLAFLFLLLDRRWIERRAPARAPTAPDRPDVASPSPAPPDRPDAATATRPPAPLWRPWRLASGIALGAAVATKWSGLSAVAAAALLALLWERSRRRGGGGTSRPLLGAVREESFGIVVAFLLVPIAVYLVSYSGWFVEQGASPGAWWRLQADMAEYHLNLETVDAETGDAIHPYLSDAWTWLVMRRPVAYYYREVGPEKLRAEIVGIGNPAIFWTSLVAIPYLAVAWWRRRDWHAGFVLVPIVGQYGPWFLASRPLFFFYMTPIVPFLVLGLVYGLRRLSAYRVRLEDRLADGTVLVTMSRHRPFQPVVIALVVLSVGLFAWFWPVLTGQPIPPSASILEGGGWRERIWFDSWV